LQNHLLALRVPALEASLSDTGVRKLFGIQVGFFLEIIIWIAVRRTMMNKMTGCDNICMTAAETRTSYPLVEGTRRSGPAVLRTEATMYRLFFAGSRRWFCTVVWRRRFGVWPTTPKHYQLCAILPTIYSLLLHNCVFGRHVVSLGKSSIDSIDSSLVSKYHDTP